MAKTKKAPAAPVDEDDAIFQQRAMELKEEGNRLFAERQYKLSSATFEQGLKLMATGAPEAAALHASRGACFLHLRQYADVVVETTRALQISPMFDKALVYRARAYNAIGNAKKAKADTVAALAVNAKNDEAKAMLALFEPKKEVQGLGGGLALPPPKKATKKAAAVETNAMAVAVAKEAETAAVDAARQAAETRLAMAERQRASADKQRKEQMAWGPPLTVKGVCGNDIRSFIVPSMISHKDLMTSLQRKFPDTPAFTVRYTAEDGVLKPLNRRADFILATAAAALSADKTKRTLHGIPSVKLIITELNQVDTPKVVEEDAAPAGTATPLPPNEVVEIDEWILDFAALFREHLGIDAEAHLDLHAEGLELCNEALEPPIAMSAADDMLKTASDKFQEAAALALFNWGNVHMCAARKTMDGGRDPPLEEGGPPGAAIATAAKFDEVVARLDQAKGRYEAALGVKPDFHDASIALAQRRYERARLLCAAAGLSGDGNSPAEGHDGAARAKEAEAEFQAACGDFLVVLNQLPEEPPKAAKAEEAPAIAAIAAAPATATPPITALAVQAGEAGEAGQKAGEADAEVPAEEPSMRAQVLVMWGNTLFEHSQMSARLSKAWRPLLDTAIAKFRDAGCAQADIDQALKVHRGVRAANEAESKK